MTKGRICSSDEKINFRYFKQRFNENILDDQVKWEYLKYNIIKYIVNFAKKLLKSTNRITAGLETKLKHFKNIAKTMLITQIIKSVSNN